MSEAEVAAFAAEPNLDAILRVRRYDDCGKEPGLNTPDFAAFVPIIDRVVAAHQGASNG